MEADEAPPPPPPWKQNKSAAAIESSSGPLASAAARLSARSRAIPPARDFHFYNNFPSFKSPIGAAAARAESSLGILGASSLLPKQQQSTFPREDLDDAYDWLVARNDDLLEMFGASADEFKATREKEESAGRKVAPDELAGDGFQVVSGKKKKIDTGEEGVGRGEAFGASGSVRMATMDKAATSGTKPKVPFHIPTIPRPQDVYRIVVDNTSKPFQHAFLERSDDGARSVHPLEKLPMEQLFDRRVLESEPLKPSALDDTPFTYVEDRKTLEVLATKLKNATEFAVDLEHNHYRTFQGLTCLMQISTRTEDFIVDTLKLRNYLGENLREIFQDPTKKKVMHGADRDIIWLQRDFGIYVCNLFDTGQASRILQMDRNSLEHLLHHFCGVTANKEYQSADWRLRPLPAEMTKYAREDTHYLLYIYDLMRLRLVSESSGENDLLLEVCKRSNEVCLQLYEKEQLTDSSYLYIHGLKENELSSRQLAVLAGLHQWRDSVARAEDESTGYILPNKTLLEIAKQMPVTTGRLKRTVRSKNKFLDHHIGHVITIIRNAVANSDAFESIAEQLKKGRLEELMVADAKNSSEDTEMISAVCADSNENFHPSDESAVVPTVLTNIGIASSCTGNVTSGASLGDLRLDNTTPETKSFGTLSGITDVADTEILGNSGQQQVAKATVQVSKRPTAFGALLGKPSSGRKPNIFPGFSTEQTKSKVDKIKSSVVLPFHHFSGGAEPLAASLPVVKSVQPEPEIMCNDPASRMEEVIQLDTGTDDRLLQEIHNADGQRECEHEDAELSSSPSELSSGMGQQFRSLNESRNLQQNQKAATKSKVDKIKSSVVLPFHHFSGGAEPLAASLPVVKSVQPEPEIMCNDPASRMEEVIQLDTGTDDRLLQEIHNADGQRECEHEDAELSSSPSELSSGMGQQFRSLNESRNLQQNQKAPEEHEFNDKLKTFDYAEARKNILFGEVKADRRKDNAVARAINKDSGDKQRTSKQPGGEEDEENFQNPRRRQAFPPSGNRSSTYH